MLKFFEHNSSVLNALHVPGFWARDPGSVPISLSKYFVSYFETTRNMRPTEWLSSSSFYSLESSFIVFYLECFCPLIRLSMMAVFQVTYQSSFIESVSFSYVACSSLHALLRHN